MEPRTFGRVVLGALGALVAIIYTGSLVRLTGSGLGCVDWPACNELRFIDVTSGHAAIEQVNRLFTGVVAAAVVAAVMSAFLVRPRIRHGRLLAIGLVLGVAVQVIIGGIVVLTGLNPWSNMAHFLVSILLVTNAVVLHDRFDERREPVSISEPTRRLAWLTVGMITLTVLLGTVVTATGPHAGDADAPRFELDLGSVARLHSVAALSSVVLILWLTRRSRRVPEEWLVVGRRIEILLFWIVAQIFVGYLQYFSGVPVPLVFVHIVLSVVVWLSALRLGMSVVRRPARAERLHA